jgi:hypothetical protein
MVGNKKELQITNNRLIFFQLSHLFLSDMVKNKQQESDKQRQEEN